MMMMADLIEELPDPSVLQSIGKKKDQVAAEKTRSKFIRMVHLIQLIRLLITFGIGYVIFTNENVRNVILKNPQLYLLSVMVTIFLIFVVVCIPDLMFTRPYNYIAMITIVMDEILIFAVVISYYHYSEIIISFGLCVLFVLILLILSLQPIVYPTFVIKLAFLFILLLLSTGIIVWIYELKWTLILICTTVPLLFGIYVIYDTNLMITGQHQFEYGNEDYLPGSFDIILDFERFFLYILVGMVEFLISKL